MSDRPCSTDQNRRLVTELLARPDARGVLLAASRDPDAKLTFVLTRPLQDRSHRDGSALAVKIPVTANAGRAVECEARMLVELRRMGLGDLGMTVPRYVESMHVGGRPVLVATALEGTPMSVGYHQWLHTARRECVRDDFRLALGWLSKFQSATGRDSGPLTWGEEVGESLRGRWDGHPKLDAALARVAAAQQQFDTTPVVRTAVHGDFWFGNVLVSGGHVKGVVDWEAGTTDGWPLRDLARFVLSYLLYLDRHTRPGHAVPGHRSLHRTGFAPGVVYGLLGRGWMPRVTRAALMDGLAGLGLPAQWWYAVALAGIGEVAASANDDEFGAGHLEVLAGLPMRPRRYREIR
jgi:hypothetical protein